MDILTQRGLLYRAVLDLITVLLSNTLSIGVINPAEPLKAHALSVWCGTRSGMLALGEAL